LAFLGRSAVAKPRTVLNLVDTRYIHKGGWNLKTW